MIDHDGKFNYSNVILLSTYLHFEVKPLRNPFRNTINTEVIVPSDGLLNIKIYNDKGQLFRTIQQVVKKGTNNINLENINATEGLYIMSVNFKNESIRTKLIKVN